METKFVHWDWDPGARVRAETNEIQDHLEISARLCSTITRIVPGDPPILIGPCAA